MLIEALNNLFRSAFDSYANALTTISEPHRLTHDGKVFHASGTFTGILDTTSVYMLLRTPASCFPHMHRMRLTVGAGDVYGKLFEAGTVIADGTPVTPVNTNRNSSNTPDLLLFAGPTVTGDGTELHDKWLPPTAAGVGQTHAGLSDAEAGEEWILKPSTDYLLKVTNDSGATITAQIELLWYELN